MTDVCLRILLTALLLTLPAAALGDTVLITGANSGIGLWVKPAPLTQGGPINVLGETDPAIEEVQRLLARYGYGVAATGYFDSSTRDVVAAFQRRFRPMRVDGVVDASTIATLRALIAERDAWLSRSTREQTRS